jgi:hypothetical protein
MGYALGMTSYAASSAPPPSRPPLSFFRLALFVPTSLTLAALLGGAAAQTQILFAPLFLFPILLGIVLGALLVGLMRFTQTAHRPTVLIGALLAVAVICVVQHYISYWMSCQAANARNDWKMELARAAFGGRLTAPDGFVAFLRQEAERGRPLFGGYTAHGAWVWASWALDAVLTAVGVMAVVAPALRLPYCSRCSSWYRTTRSGRLKSGATVALASAADIVLDDKPHRARYRLSGCQGGCEPTGLELIWRDEAGESTAVVSWLTHDHRDAVVRILDQR